MKSPAENPVPESPMCMEPGECARRQLRTIGLALRQFFGTGMLAGVARGVILIRQTAGIYMGSCQRYEQQGCQKDGKHDGLHDDDLAPIGEKG